MDVNKVVLQPATCALDLGDGSERGFYVNQDYILQKLKKTHRGISLMYTYYPNDVTWPTRACLLNNGDETKGAWDSPYENYFPYRGGREGLLDDDPFNFMREIRQHGQDVVLSLTMDPKLKREDIIPIAKDLRPYGRILLRVNHECTGNWFCYNKRASYQELADFFVMVAGVMHEFAPNVKMILCAGMWQADTGKLEMEDIFLEAHKVADIWSGDNYLSLHWGWPVDIATKENVITSHAAYDVDEVYQKAKNTLLRLREITGQDKPFVLSEMNADGDTNGPFEQMYYMKYFMELLQKDKEHWLSAFTLYQFRDDGRLGLEVTDPNNCDVGIEQPILEMYREQLHREFFSSQIVSFDNSNCVGFGNSNCVGFDNSNCVGFDNSNCVGFDRLNQRGNIEGVKLRWGGAEDAEGVEMVFKIHKTPHYCEMYFDGDLIPMNLMIEMNGYWFYKAPGVKFIDLMSYFFDNPKLKRGVFRRETSLKIRIFCPPQNGMNADPVEAREAPDGDWLYNSYTVLPCLPRVRIEEEPMAVFKKYR